MFDTNGNDYQGEKMQERKRKLLEDLEYVDGEAIKCTAAGGGFRQEGVRVCGSVCQLLSCAQLCNPQRAARQAPLSMGVSRQVCCCGLPCHSPRDLPDPGIKPESPELQADSSPSQLQEDQQYIHSSKKGNRYLSTGAGRPVAVVVAVDVLFSAKQEAKSLPEGSGDAEELRREEKE